MEEDNLFKIFLIQDEEESLKKFEIEKAERLGHIEAEIDKVASSSNDLNAKLMYKSERNKLLMNVINPKDEGKKHNKSVIINLQLNESE